MFAADDNGRVPVVAVSGTNGKTTTIRLTAHLIAQTGKRIGMTTTDGVYANGRLIDTGDCSGPRSARNVLGHPDVDAAVLETARGGILREGLGFDRCDVAVITNIGEGDHLGMNFINTSAELAAVKRVIVQNVSPEGTAVLNAADPLVARMARYCTGNVTFFAGQSAAHPVRAEGDQLDGGGGGPGA
jgi:cyanophycin synthetase